MLGRPADVPSARRTAAPAARPIRMAAIVPAIVVFPLNTAATAPSRSSQRPVEPRGRARCALTTAITAAAMPMRAEGKRSPSVRPDVASAPGQFPVASRAATRERSAASTTASRASTVIRHRPANSGATSMATDQRMRSPIMNPQTGRSQSGNASTNRRPACSSCPGGCAAIVPASPRSDAPSRTTSVARRTRDCCGGAA